MAVSAPPVVFKHKRTTLERAEKFISDAYFTDVNLYGRLYPDKRPVSLSHRKVNGRVTFAEATDGWATGINGSKYPPAEETQTGTSYGPTWATHWFLLSISIPDDWQGKEVHLRWNSGSEAMVWSTDGKPLQGLNKDDRTSFRLTRQHQPGPNSHMKLYIEMACNFMFGAGDGLIGPPNLDRTFALSQAEIAVFNRDAFELIRDIEILVDMVKHIPEDNQRCYQALYTVNRMVNACEADKPETYQAARDICKQFMAQRNGDSAYTIHACGNAHIDSAWLWPYAETKRKVARTWANVIRLMEDYPQFTFVFSQAQQFAWVKANYPSLFDKIKSLADRGRFIPVGGCWVEMDGNLPSGESFVRQLLYGQRFFKEEFGSYCTEFWLPDTFGYSAQLPQILAGAGIKRFVSQKLSWSLVNKFPHNTFWWQGIDGTKCLAHFPPNDDYCSKVTVEEILKSAKNNRDKGRVNHSLLLYGHGDGGGGPDMNMLERLIRLKDTDGLPKVKESTPRDFFSVIEADSEQLCTWQGELYLELHQGTFTTQGETKMLNRLLEVKFRHLEFLSAVQLSKTGRGVVSQETISDLWKRLLLHQFHDVLPGSSIREVVKDSTSDMKALVQELDAKAEELMTAICKHGVPHKEGAAPSGKMPVIRTILCNNLSWAREEVVDLSHDAPGCDESERQSKKARRGPDLAFVKIPAMSMDGDWSVHESESYAGIEILPDNFRMYNKYLEAYIDSRGRLINLTLRNAEEHQERDAIPSGHHGNQFVVFDDVPLFWDAWDVMDYHLETRKPVSDCVYVEVEERSGLRGVLRVKWNISEKSWIEQRIIVTAAAKYLEFDTKVHWQESHKFLKVEFPVNVHAPHATFDIQFGHLQRPTHQNTSWDWAKYEVVGHKWMDLSEYNWGVAILNNCKYGHSVTGNVMRLSLLRSPKSPDAQADMGDHAFSYAIMPHLGTFQDAGVIQAAYEFNNPLAPVEVTLDSHSRIESHEIFTIEPSSVIIDTVKKAEGEENALIVRCYEAYGGRAKAMLSTKLNVERFARCNLLEEEEEEKGGLQDAMGGDGDAFARFTLRPFQVASIKLYLP